jgi:transposase-like protein
MPLFPCPFCRSPHVTRTGGGLKFAHYRCDRCSEVWTAQTTTRPAPARAKAVETAVFPPRVSKKVPIH